VLKTLICITQSSNFI